MKGLAPVLLALLLSAPLSAQQGQEGIPIRLTYPGCEDRETAHELAEAYEGDTSEAYYSAAKRHVLKGACITLGEGRSVRVVTVDDSLGLVEVRLEPRRKGEPERVWIDRDALRDPS